MKKKVSVVRKALYAVLLLAGFFALYTIYDIRQAKHMAAEACSRAVPGTLLSDFLPGIAEKEFRIIRSSGSTVLVPRKGMGRNSCTVLLDGQKILNAKTSFTD